MAIRDNISISNVSQSIDLSEIYGRAPTETEKQEFAELARDLVIDRTQSSTKRGGGKFKEYSEAYADFKGSDQVDLTLFGDMLEAVDARTTGNGVELFIDPNDELNTKKAFNHHTGDSPGMPARPFFGLEREEAEELANQVKRVIDEPGLIETVGSASAFQAQGLDIASVFDTGFNDSDIASILSQIGLLND